MPMTPPTIATGPLPLHGDEGLAQGRGALERMPKWLICVPLVLQWLWLGLRYRT